MYSEFIQIFLALLEGFALILSPCILPILPFILAGSLEGGRKRPYGIIVGFVLAFSLFTFFARAIVRYSGLDLMLVRDVSFVLLFLFGLIMLSTYLTEKFTLLTGKLLKADRYTSEQNGWLSGIGFGMLVGLIWTPCAGPILAAVIVQSVLQQTNWGSFLIVIAFGIGAGLPMLLIALFGRTLLSQMTFLKRHMILIRKLLGVIVILSVFYMIYAEAYPKTFTERTLFTISGKNLINELSEPYPAPDFANTPEWINSKPLEIKDLRGKVVLIDFWTYSCINCIRTFPYLKDWYEKYHSKGLEIVGVHTPEFEFEKNVENVRHAVKANGLLYPVVLDNQYRTWQNYQNRYWPAHYLIDKKGQVVYQHFGEGEYATTENNIRYLLGLKENITPDMPTERNIQRQTPETYLGLARATTFAGSETRVANTATNYTFPNELIENTWALQGTWQSSPEAIKSMASGASLRIHFYARKVFIVMGSASSAIIPVKILLNGKIQSEIQVQRNQLYQVLTLSKADSGILELIVSQPGLEVYTFTFGE